MDDALAVEVADCLEDLLGDRPSLGFAVALPGLNSVEELTALAELHYDVDLGRGFETLVELDDVRVIQPAKALDLGPQQLDGVAGQPALAAVRLLRRLLSH